VVLPREESWGGQRRRKGKEFAGSGNSFLNRRQAMKHIIVVAIVFTLALWIGPSMATAQLCTTIQDGTLLTSGGDVIESGFDVWGYNYQAHIFNGTYCDAYRNAAWCQPYVDVELIMKWNDAWLSNKDCGDDSGGTTPDGNLDRHYGFASYQGSGAWLTNHQKGRYVDDKGKKQRWEYFVKIVAAPADATSDGSTWYAGDGTEIGPAIWGAFAVVQRVYNDTGDESAHGVEYLSPYSAGFGRFSPEK